MYDGKHYSIRDKKKAVPPSENLQKVLTPLRKFHPNFHPKYMLKVKKHQKLAKMSKKCTICVYFYMAWHNFPKKYQFCLKKKLNKIGENFFIFKIQQILSHKNAIESVTPRTDRPLGFS